MNKAMSLKAKIRNIANEKGIPARSFCRVICSNVFWCA